jgi:hypothetical protein
MAMEESVEVGNNRSGWVRLLEDTVGGGVFYFFQSLSYRDG